MYLSLHTCASIMYKNIGVCEHGILNGKIYCLAVLQNAYGNSVCEYTSNFCSDF